MADRPIAPAAPASGRGDRPVLIDLREVTVTDPRSGRTLLGPLSLRVDAGERVLVMGPSGSGKSTLLDVISGVIPHSVVVGMTGEVTVAGRVVADTPVHELSRDVGVVAQDPAASICLPVVESEVALTLENHGVDPAVMDDRIGAALRSVDAAWLRDRRTRELSGGQTQRVATAAALAARPRIVLVDEPTSMLDAAGISAVLDAVSSLSTADGATVVVDHRLDEMATRDPRGLPARTIVLDNGRVLADGPTAAVLDEHAERLDALGTWLPFDLELALRREKMPATTSGDLGHSGQASGAEPVGSGAPSRGTATRQRSDRAPAPLVSARDLRVRRGQREILHGVDLTLEPGTVTALLGPNGAGKTSLLLALAGVLRPSDGDLTSPDGGAAAATMVFQNPEHQFMTTQVRDEARYGLETEEHPRADALLERLRLGPLDDANPFRLSGGEKRRLSVAAALATDHPLLLADEPTYGLDRHDTHRVLGALAGHARTARAGGGAVMFATHDLRQAATWADRIVVLADGAVRTAGPTWSVLSSGALEAVGVQVPPLLAHLADRPAGEATAILRALEPDLQASLPPQVAHRGEQETTT